MSLNEEKGLAQKAWSYVHRVVFINLKRRPDRLKEIEAEFERLLVPTHKIHRFEAIDGSVGLSPNADRETIERSSCAACAESHLKCLELAHDSKWENVLILEDDFQFDRDRVLVWKQMVASFSDPKRSTYDVMMLAASNLSQCMRLNSYLAKARGVSNASGYLVHQRFYKKLLDLWSPNLPLLKSTGSHWLYMHDQSWKTLQSDPTVEWYLFSPLLGYQRPSFSDLGQRFMDYAKDSVPNNVHLNRGSKGMENGWTDITDPLSSVCQIPSQSVDSIYAPDLLDRVSSGELVQVLLEWNRVCKMGATLRISVPDFEAIALWYTKHPHRLSEVKGLVNDGKHHVFDFFLLSRLLNHCGFTAVERYHAELFLPPNFQDTSSHNHSSMCLNVTAPQNKHLTTQDAVEPYEAWVNKFNR